MAEPPVLPHGATATRSRRRSYVARSSGEQAENHSDVALVAPTAAPPQQLAQAHRTGPWPDPIRARPRSRASGGRRLAGRADAHACGSCPAPGAPRQGGQPCRAGRGEDEDWPLSKTRLLAGQPPGQAVCRGGGCGCCPSCMRVCVETGRAVGRAPRVLGGTCRRAVRGAVLRRVIELSTPHLAGTTLSSAPTVSAAETICGPGGQGAARLPQGRHLGG